MTGAQTPTAGVILAGGQSRRMFPERGQGDKGLLDLGGRPMLDHVIASLAPQTARLAINANGDQGRFAGYGLPVVADTIGGGVGPLAGILAGMRWAAEVLPGARYLVSSSGDAPFIPTDLVERLGAALASKGGGIAIARSLGELHPVIGLWPVALADDLEAAIRAGVRKVLHWTDRHGTVGVDFVAVRRASVTIDPFFNANTPAELDEARRMLALITS